MTMPLLRVGAPRRETSHAASAETIPQRAFAEVLNALAALPSPNSSDVSNALQRWAQGCLAGGSRDALTRLSEADRSALRSRFGARLDALNALALESDPVFLANGLAAWAREAAGASELGVGAGILDYLASERSALTPRLDESLRAHFAAQSAAWRGEGSFGTRFEWQARDFVRQASDPALIAGMGVASLVSSVVRVGVLSRLAASPTTGIFSRGLGASALAGTAAWAAEVPAFWATNRLVHGATSTQSLAWDRATILHELGSTALLLGLLKVSGAGSNAVFNRFHGINAMTAEASLPALTRISQPIFTQTGTFAGIYADHILEERLGWRPQSDFWTRGFDSLATLLQFHVGGNLAAEALGPRYASLLSEIELRRLSVETLNHSSDNSSAGLGEMGPSLALAGGGESELRPSWDSGILQMSQMKPERGRGPRGRRVPAPLDSRTEERVPETVEEAMLNAFRTSPAKGLNPLLRGLYERGQLAELALSLEGSGLRPDLSASDLARAREVLKNLEDDFWGFLDQGRQQVPIADRWQVFQDWQKDLAPKGMEGFLYLQQRMRSVGISDISAIKEGEARIRNRVRDSLDAAEHFLDLALVRQFLRSRGLNKVDDKNPNGIYLSHLLLNGDGNCVTLGFLFAHLASKTGRPLQLGLLPRHVYLHAGEGAAVESILDYGITSASAYRNRAIPAEQKPLPVHAILSLHLLNLGKALLDRGDFAAAQSALLRARDLLPRSPRADLMLAQAAQRQGNLAATLDHYRQVYALHPSDAKGLNNLRFRAWERFQAGQYAEAEKAFLLVNSKMPEDVDALRALALTYRKMNLPREAQGVENMIDVMLMDSEEP